MAETPTEFQLVNAQVLSMQVERLEKTIPTASIPHSPKFTELCRLCPHFGKNLACPPNTPDFATYTGLSGSAHIICFRIPLADPKAISADRQRADIRQAGAALSKELKTLLLKGYKVAGAGGCRSCEVCAGERGITVCSKPSERIFSLESMGVDVSALVKQCFGFSLEWNTEKERANYLCTVGAIFSP